MDDAGVTAAGARKRNFAVVATSMADQLKLVGM